MKIIGGNPIWTKINKVTQRYNSLKTDINCDILIVGGGITGAICSYYLSKQGIKCALIEQDLIGTSSTSTCTSLLQYEIDLDIIGLSKKIGESNAKRAFLLCENALKDISEIVKQNDLDCSYSEVPSLYYTNN